MTQNTANNNPFVSEWKIKMKYIPIGTTASNDSGLRYTINAVDTEEFISLYTTDFLEVFIPLSKSGKDLLMYIMAKLNAQKKFNRDYLEIREEEVSPMLKISRVTYYRAMKELREVFILPRKSRKHTYWINPKYFFKGNRVKAYPHLRVFDDSAGNALNRHMYKDSFSSDPDKK